MHFFGVLFTKRASTFFDLFVQHTKLDDKYRRLWVFVEIVQFICRTMLIECKNPTNYLQFSTSWFFISRILLACYLFLYLRMINYVLWKSLRRGIAYWLCLRIYQIADVLAMWRFFSTVLFSDHEFFFHFT